MPSLDHLIQSPSRIRFRLAPWICGLTLLFGLLCAGSASGQLRSGRAVRPLYAEDVRPGEAESLPRRQPERASQRSDSDAVQPASHVAPPRSQPSVVSVSCSDCDAMGSSAFHANHVSGFDDGYVDDGYIVSQGGMLDSYAYQGNSGGCGGQCGAGGGCDCGGFHDLAPMSMAACPPGCGPLMAIWCRLSVRAEVPLYWRRAAGPPALVTTSPAGTASTIAGRLPASATTSVLLGDETLNEDATAGFRLTLGTWLDRDQRMGLMFRYWMASDQDDTFNFNSTTTPILARPFFNTTTNGSFAQDAQLISFPGDSNGSISVASTSSIDGLDLSLRRLIYRDRFTRIDGIYGYKHVNIDEGLSITSNTNVTGAIPGLQGASIGVFDDFQTENQFDGVSYGLMSTRRFARLKMETMFRLGAGNLRRKVRINGSTRTVSAVGAVSTSNQGLLARNTNNQPFTDDTFVVVPEVAISFAYTLRPGLDFNLGYNYMMLPKVAQASQQINDNLAVNLSDPLVGALDPALNFDERDYWIQSLGFGLQLRY